MKRRAALRAMAMCSLAATPRAPAYTARYAATDFNLQGGAPEPGYQKLRGLILLEGGGASLSSTPPDEATLDLIEARFDGGLYGAVRDQAPRCIDGDTACTVATADTTARRLATSPVSNQSSPTR